MRWLFCNICGVTLSTDDPEFNRIKDLLVLAHQNGFIEGCKTKLDEYDTAFEAGIRFAKASSRDRKHSNKHTNYRCEYSYAGYNGVG